MIRRKISLFVLSVCLIVLTGMSFIHIHVPNALIVQSQSGDCQDTITRLGHEATHIGGWSESETEIHTAGRSLQVRLILVQQDYFNVLPVRMLYGRSLFPQDTGKKTAILEESAAVQLFGTADTVGQTVAVSGTDYTVYGVFQSSKLARNGQSAMPTVYISDPDSRRLGPNLCFLFPEDQDTALLSAGVLRTLRQADYPISSTILFSREEAAVSSVCAICAFILLLLLSGQMIPGKGKAGRRRLCIFMLTAFAMTLLYVTALQLVSDSSVLPDKPDEQSIQSSIAALTDRIFSLGQTDDPWSMKIIQKRQYALWLLLAGFFSAGCAGRKKEE